MNTIMLRILLRALLAACAAFLTQTNVMAQSADDKAIVFPPSIDWPPSGLSSQIVDRGYAGYHQMIDVQGDGNPGFCRFVGDAPNGVFLSCQLSVNPNYLSRNPYGMNSPKGLQMGSPPWGIIPGSPGGGGARYCASFEVPMKRSIAPSAPLHGYNVQCVLGVPAVRNSPPKFLNTYINPCAAGFTARLLTENDSHRDPYLFCSNETTGQWNAERIDPDGHHYVITSFPTYDRFSNSTMQSTLIREIPQKVPVGHKTPELTSLPIRFASWFTVNSDGSTNQIDQVTSGNGNTSDDVTTNIFRVGEGFKITISIETCYVSKGNCTRNKYFSGASNDGVQVTWNDGNAPSDADIHPFPVEKKFNQIGLAQAEALKAKIAKSDPALAAIDPKNWTPDNISKIVTILTASSGPNNGSVSTQQSTWWGGMLAWHVTALTVAVTIIAPEAEVAAYLFELGNIGLSALLELGNLQSDADAQAAYKYCLQNPHYKNCGDLLFQKE